MVFRTLIKETKLPINSILYIFKAQIVSTLKQNFGTSLQSKICQWLQNFNSTNPILGEGGGEVADCEAHTYKYSWIFQKRLIARIWHLLTFTVYYLGPFSQNFRSASLFLRKLEPFCRGWLEKFCLVAKIQHFLSYRYFTFCQTKYTMDAVLLC